MSKDPGYSDSRKDTQGSRIRDAEAKIEQLKIAVNKATDLLAKKDEHIKELIYALTEGDQYAKAEILRKLGAK